MALRNLVLFVGLVSAASAAFNWCRVFHADSQCLTSCPPGSTPHVQELDSVLFCEEGFSCCGVPSEQPVVDPSDQTTPDADACGLVPGRSRRSIGGGAATRCSWPWLVSVRLSSPAFTSFHAMNAVLVSKEHLLVNKRLFDIYKDIPGGTLEANSGDYFINMDGDEEEKEILDLPNPDHIDLEQFDLTILKLTNEVNVSSCVRPVCTSNTPTDLNMGACKMVGWGRRDSGNRELAFAAVPLEQGVTILDETSCSAISRVSGVQLTENLLCLDMEAGHSTTEDDLGSPVMCPDNNNQWYLQGVLIRSNYNETTKSAPTLSYAVAFDPSWILPLALF
ncbi:transmembrane protease serine 9-like [Haliotis rubra]|uniref:transmembrane protease serine 9-like n=1 Tax=Haliotis rubra TaxID=36100 RepID=UPI001EE543FF|nr:transmembrane protease serine 9-like [Haliotis rubra]